jgi:hypothetical protein
MVKVTLNGIFGNVKLNIRNKLSSKKILWPIDKCDASSVLAISGELEAIIEIGAGSQPGCFCNRR